MFDGAKIVIKTASIQRKSPKTQRIFPTRNEKFPLCSPYVAVAIAKIAIISQTTFIVNCNFCEISSFFSKTGVCHRIFDAF